MYRDLAWWRNLRLVGWRSDYEGHLSKEATKEFKILFIGVVYKVTWKAMRKKAFISLLSLQHFFTWGWDQKSINFDLQLEEKSDFLQAGQKFQSILWRKQIFVISNYCQDMLQINDEIISQSFLVIRVFNLRLTNIEVGFISQTLVLELLGLKSTWNWFWIALVSD